MSKGGAGWGVVGFDRKWQGMEEKVESACEAGLRPLCDKGRISGGRVRQQKQKRPPWSFLDHMRTVCVPARRPNGKAAGL